MGGSRSEVNREGWSELNWGVGQRSTAHNRS